MIAALRRLAARLRGAAGGGRSDADVAAELDAHVAMATDARVASGMSGANARRAALLAAGGVEQAKESVRDQRGFPAVESVVRDARFAIRSLRKNPGFAATVVLTLALSIGATTAMFSVVNGILLDPLPFANGDRLVWTVNHGTRPYDSMSPPDFHDWGTLNNAFEAVGGWMVSGVDLVGGAAPVHLTSADVSGNWFTMLGVRMVLGRGLVASDEGVGKPKIAVLSYGLWQRQFGGDRSVVGHAILLDGNKYTVVGVAPRAFQFPSDADIWRPVIPYPTWPNMRGSRFIRGPVALLKRGVSFDQARRQARLVAAQLRASYPEAEQGLEFDIQPLREHLVGSSRKVVVVLFGAVAMLLLIACANVATLLLVRAASRSGEIGIRLALGAGGRRVAAQLIVESLMLAVVGAALGVVIAEGTIRIVAARAAASVALASGLSIDWTVLAFTTGVAVLAGLGFGLAPALQAARTDVVEALKSGGRASSAKRASSRIRHALVALEILLVLPLLIGASLLTRSFGRLMNVDPGFRADQVVSFDLTLPKCGTAWAPDTTCVGVQGTTYMTDASVAAFGHQLLDRLRAMPGTESAAFGFGAPFSDWAINQATITVIGDVPPPRDRPNIVESKIASPGYFQTLHIPILKGRDFTDADRRKYTERDAKEVQWVGIVSEAAAKAYFHGDAIGKRIAFGGTGTMEIVGVVGDTKTQSLNGAPEPAWYSSFWQNPVFYITGLVRSTADPGTVMRGIRAQVAAVDPSLPIFHLRPMRDAVDASAARQRLAANVVGGFALSALLLAMIGIYGVIAYAVRDRQRELGIRIALGATRSGVVRLVVRDGLVLAAIGVVAGIAASVAASRVLSGLLYDIAPTDAGTYAAAGVTLIGVAAFAAWLPARRAARVDPMIAMRPE
ncbi:MAG TPA: ABC transporter permease [Gemmatimonadaceae bacterium]|nr:ABC transporter permease [Gemmatimonadaceae bacterium]